MNNELITKAEQDYKEFCELFGGKTLEEVNEIVTNNNLCYGSANPDTEEEMYDINYKSICATIVRREGMCVISPDVEIYNEEGVLICVGDITNTNSFKQIML